jgi:hypothetical protein
MRWLLSQGEIDRVIQMLTKVAKVNQKPLSEDLVRKFKVSQHDLPIDVSDKRPLLLLPLLSELICTLL